MRIVDLNCLQSRLTVCQQMINRSVGRKIAMEACGIRLLAFSFEVMMCRRSKLQRLSRKVTSLERMWRQDVDGEDIP